MGNISNVVKLEYDKHTQSRLANLSTGQIVPVKNNSFQWLNDRKIFIWVIVNICPHELNRVQSKSPRTYSQPD